MKIFQEQTNIRTAYILSFFSELFFPITAWLFFYLRYLNFTEIALLTAIGGIASNILEIPTGAFADLVGRKTAIFISYLIFAIAMFGMAFSTSFWFFLLFTLLNSLCNSLYSGSLEALVYDTMKEDGKLDKYDHVISKVQGVVWIGLFVGAILGGFMYNLWFRLPYLIQGVFMLLAAFVALRLKEPVIDTQQYNIKAFLKQNIAGFKELFNNFYVGQVSFFFIVLTAGFYVASSILGISQARQYGLNAGTTGVLFACGYIISSGISFLYPWMRKKLQMEYLLGIIIFALLGSFFFAQYAGLIFGCLLIIMRIASSTTFRNTRSIMLNKYIDSKNRATALSTLTLLSQLPYAFSAYFIGKYIDKTSPNAFAFLLGAILAAILVAEAGINIFFKRKASLSELNKQVA